MVRFTGTGFSLHSETDGENRHDRAARAAMGTAREVVSNRCSGGDGNERERERGAGRLVEAEGGAAEEKLGGERAAHRGEKIFAGVPAAALHAFAREPDAGAGGGGRAEQRGDGGDA